MRVLVTGGAGFIGSHLVDTLVREHEVTVIDNLSSGRREVVNSRAEFIRTDLFNDEIDEYFLGKDLIFHLAANPDVRLGAVDTKVHLEQNILVTYRILEAMKRKLVKKIVFASTSTVYGEAPKHTHEDYGPLVPISLYGASKLACEGLIYSYCHTFDLNAWVYRLANVVGLRSNHGVIYDFVRKLMTNSGELDILGDGYQNKSYIYVKDCVEAMLYGLSNSERTNIFNVGSDDQVTTKRIAEIVSEEMKLVPRFNFGGGRQGWKGDVTDMLLSSEKLKSLGWRPIYSSSEAVRMTVRDILKENIFRGP